MGRTNNTNDDNTTMRTITILVCALALTATAFAMPSYDGVVPEESALQEGALSGRRATYSELEKITVSDSCWGIKQCGATHSFPVPGFPHRGRRATRSELKKITVSDSCRGITAASKGNLFEFVMRQPGERACHQTI